MGLIESKGLAPFLDQLFGVLAMIGYFCYNAGCFYYECLIDFSESVAKHYWNKKEATLDVRFHCPCCDEVLSRDEICSHTYKGYKDGSVQTFISTPQKKST